MLGFQRISLTLGAVCRQAGHRFGDHVERVVPLVLKYAQVEDDELREHCLQACENMVYKCGKEITPHIPTIQKMCLVSFIFQKNIFVLKDVHRIFSPFRKSDCNLACSRSKK